jgi:hypothetical protein
MLNGEPTEVKRIIHVLFAPGAQAPRKRAEMPKGPLFLAGPLSHLARKPFRL